MVRSINEANARYKARLNNKKVGIQVTAKRISSNQYLIECEDELPETFQFKLWLDKPEDNSVHDEENELQAVYWKLNVLGNSK